MRDPLSFCLISLNPDLSLHAVQRDDRSQQGCKNSQNFYPSFLECAGYLGVKHPSQCKGENGSDEKSR